MSTWIPRCQTCGITLFHHKGDTCHDCELRARQESHRVARQPQVVEPVWTTKDKERVPIADMKTDHLTNTIEMLKRNAVPHLEKAGFKPTEVWRIYPIITDMQSELDRRLRQQTEEDLDDASIRFSLLELD
jgi:uncharacterized Zn finger protein (UPF0148 family)